MSTHVLGSFEPRSTAWHEARRGRIGGSDIGVVCGWSPFMTRTQLLAEKAGLRDQRVTSDAMERGNLPEGAVVEWLLGKHGLTDAPAESDCTYVGGPDDRYLYNPDRIVYQGDERVLLEAKTTSDRTTEKGWGRAGTDQVPLTYAAQTIWGMGLLSIDTCHLGVLSGGINGRPSLTFATYTVHFKQHVYDHMARKADQFLADLDSLTQSRGGR